MKLKLVAAAASVTSPSSVLPVFLSATAFVATSHVSLASSASTFAFATAFRPSPHFARSFHFHSPSTTAKIATTATTSMKTRRSLTSKDAAPATPSLEPAPSKKRRKAGRMKKEDSDDVVDNEKATTGPWYTSFTKGDEQYERYMATEWGFEKRGDVALFEKLCLEGAQSGLSWLTILRKREAYRRTFHNFDIDSVARMTDRDVQQILALEIDKNNASGVVVRHRGKIEAVIHNAKCIQQMRQEAEEAKNKYPHGVFDHFLWSFVNHQPIVNVRWDGKSLNEASSKTTESEAMSKALKQKGFKFVGPTTCYSLMQSCGLVIDHPMESPQWKAALKRLEDRPGGYQMMKK